MGIDASGFDRSHASKHYTKRAKLTIQQLKVTLLVDTRANVILDLHITTTRKHDTQIAPSLINRNAAKEGGFQQRRRLCFTGVLAHVRAKHKRTRTNALA